MRRVAVTNDESASGKTGTPVTPAACLVGKRRLVMLMQVDPHAAWEGR
jgi:hypothetical protein